jgi:hypothetical protein
VEDCEQMEVSFVVKSGLMILTTIRNINEISFTRFLSRHQTIRIFNHILCDCIDEIVVTCSSSYHNINLITHETCCRNNSEFVLATTDIIQSTCQQICI